MHECKVVYFDGAGSSNTEVTFSLARERALAMGIQDIVVASTAGEAGVRAADYFKGFRVVIVSHAAGYRRANEQEMTEENRRAIQDAGATVLTCLHPFGGLGRAVRTKYATFTTEEIIPNVLRLFGQGMKVVIEIAMMAADAGLVRSGEDVIAVAGTNHGADTAVVVTAVNTQRFFDLRVREILCKPR
ncbi:MAG: pyruvate kinase alpha/beta domain-containing protein [Dehalococcoidia bacterium]|nr:pyruvate kinase alpha/beta domain-containing protein [Dehalococcoidia bacterium]